MPLDRAWIEGHIPHQGRMCLLERVSEWNTQHIICLTRTHQDPANPLRAEGRLGAACGIEYAAQVMAVHGALSAGAAPDGVASAPAAGFLASVRGVSLHVAWLDDVEGELACLATRVAGDHRSALYEFEIRAGARLLVEGRATVVLDAQGHLPA